MGVISTPLRAERAAFDLSLRGYQVLFRPNETNHCPGCGRSQWYVGRVTAECVFCATALPLTEARWGRSGHVAAHDPMPAAEPLASKSPVAEERRRHLRRDGEGRIVNLLLDGTAQAFTVHNYSAIGVMIAAPPALKAAKSVGITAPSGEIVAAEVRWAGGDFCGVQFARPLPLVLAATNRSL